MKISGIYKIQSKIKPERIYIGSSININERWRRHLKDLKRNKHSSIKFQRHFNKYGFVDLEFSVLLICKKEDLIRIEQYFIDTLNPFFNICKSAKSNLGLKASKETRKRMSKSHKGINTWLKGKPLSEEHKRKLCIARKGRKPNLGKCFSEECRKKMSIAAMGNTHGFKKGYIPPWTGKKIGTAKQKKQFYNLETMN